MPMLPVEPRIEIRFWKVAPLRDSARVFLREAAELTGAEGSIHPSPVPAEPEMVEAFREVVVWRLIVDGVNEDALLARRKPLTAKEASFMVGFLLLFCSLCFVLKQSKNSNPSFTNFILLTCHIPSTYVRRLSAECQVRVRQLQVL